MWSESPGRTWATASSSEQTLSPEEALPPGGTLSPTPATGDALPASGPGLGEPAMPGKLADRKQDWEQDRG